MTATATPTLPLKDSYVTHIVEADSLDEFINAAYDAAQPYNTLDANYWWYSNEAVGTVLVTNKPMSERARTAIKAWKKGQPLENGKTMPKLRWVLADLHRKGLIAPGQYVIHATRPDNWRELISYR
jgi:hypothetical protein